LEAPCNEVGKAVSHSTASSIIAACEQNRADAVEMFDDPRVVIENLNLAYGFAPQVQERLDGEQIFSRIRNPVQAGPR